jgi:acyl-CoA thioester hydrolase
MDQTARSAKKDAKEAAQENGYVHTFSVRVYYEDTDAEGIVYYANYLKFTERGRTELLREMGAEHPALLHQDKVIFAVRHCAADYLKPARLDDLLDVHSRVLEVGGASIVFDQRVVRGEEELAVLRVKIASVSVGGRATRIPALLRERLSAICNTNEQD